MDNRQLQALDLETSVLGGLLLDPFAWERVQDEIERDLFTLESHRIIYDAIAALPKPDLLTVVQYLEERKLLTKIGGYTTVAKLVDSVINAVNIDFHVRKLKDLQLRRDIIKIAYLLEMEANEPSKTIKDVLTLAKDRLDKVFLNENDDGYRHIGDILVDAYNQVEALQTKGASDGVITGFYDLDLLTNGFQKSDLIVIAARPSMGKTALALNIAVAVAKTEPVLIYSLEMSAKQLSYRICSPTARLSSNKMTSGKMSSEEMERYSHAVGEISDLQLYINDKNSGMIDVSRVKKEATQLKLRYGKMGLIVIDYLQLMNGDSDNRVMEISKITRGLKLLALELECPIIALSQLSRAVEQRNNKRPILSDLRDSGSIEQDADLVLTLYRDEYYNPETKDKEIAELNIIKHRNGSLGLIKLLFHPEYCQFKNLLSQSF